MANQSDWVKIEGAQYELQAKTATIGNDDPVLEMTQQGKPRARFDVAVDRYRRGENNEFVKAGTDWHKVEVYGAQAENVAASLKSGDPVTISGRGDVHVRPVQKDDGTLDVAVVRSLRYGVRVAPDLSMRSVSVNPSVRAQQNVQAQQDASVSARTSRAQAEWDDVVNNPSMMNAQAANPNAGVHF